MRQYRNIVIKAACNLQCDYCSNINLKVDINKTIKQIDIIFNRFVPEDSCFRVECSGEITLYPDIINFLEVKSKEGYLIEVLSNGTNALNVIKKDSAIKWVISLDGHTISMNKHRRLSEEQIRNILEAIFMVNAEVQCVYSEQSIDEMNEFLKIFEEKGYRGMIHIFPVRLNGHMVETYLDYSKLYKVSFIADKEYFERWKYINYNQKRNFVCDYMNNGYTYIIYPTDIKMVKCDCSTRSSALEHSFGEEMKWNSRICGVCINHNEYNNSR